MSISPLLKSPPNFLIVGFPRCGTTYLWSLLRQHPDIFLPDEKEPHFFCHEDWADRLDEYQALFDPAPHGATLGEASTGYVLYPGLIDRIKSQLPDDARFIIALRDPVQRLETDYFSAFGLQKEHRPADVAISQELEATGDSAPPSDRARYLYRNTTAPKIRAWLDAFGRDRIHFYLNEDLRHQEETCLKGILEFLGVDPVRWAPPSIDQTRPNTRDGRLPPTAELLSRSSLLSPFRAAYRHLLPRTTRQAIRARFTKKERFSDADRHRLREFFAPDIAETSLLIGRDLSHWLQES